MSPLFQYVMSYHDVMYPTHGGIREVPGWAEGMAGAADHRVLVSWFLWAPSSTSAEVRSSFLSPDQLTCRRFGAACAQSSTGAKVRGGVGPRPPLTPAAPPVCALE